MRRSKPSADRGGCRIDVSKTAHSGKFVQGNAGRVEFGPRRVADENDVKFDSRHDQERQVLRGLSKPTPQTNHQYMPHAG